jgi:hypothetical protein
MIIRTKFSGYSADGIRLYPGGDSPPPPPPANTSSTVTQTTIPEYARPYVENMLGKAQAFSESPYQAYGGQRLSDFTGLQNQAFQGAAELGPAQQLGTATKMAGYSGLGSMYAGQNYANQATNPYAMGAYMSPYMQNAIAPQMREAARNSEILGQQNAGQAARAGAFGGSRFGIMEAERQRNLGQQQADIYGRGMQTAYEQARQAQQFGADLGLRGYGQALQGAGQLGQLGQSQYNQQLGAIQAQSSAGAQQQALEQQKLTQQYQDFLTQRGDPQQKLSFMSDILRGVPLGQSTQQQFTAPQSAASQIAQAGLGLYGASQFFGGGERKQKEGGIVGMANGGMVGYAGGGGIASGVAPEKLQNMLRGMGDAKQGGTDQLASIKANATDALTLALVQEEERRRELMRLGEMLGKPQSDTTVKEDMLAQALGIEGIPVPDAMFADTAVGEQAPQEEAPQEQEMARGGIVAFKDKGAVKAPPMTATQRLAAFDPKTNVIDSQAEMAAARERGIADYDRFMGQDKVAPILAEMQQATNPEITEQDRAERRALMAFEAAGAFGPSEPGKPPPTFLQGFSNAGAKLASKSAEFKKLDREAKRAALGVKLESAKLDRATMQEKWGAAEKASEKLAGHQAELKKLELQQAYYLTEDANRKAQIQATLEATRATKDTDTRAGAKVMLPPLINKFKAKNGRDPNAAELEELQAQAFTMSANLMKQNLGDYRANQAKTAENREGRERFDDFMNNRGGARELRKIAREKGQAAADRQYEAWERKYMSGGGGDSTMLDFNDITGKPK